MILKIDKLRKDIKNEEVHSLLSPYGDYKLVHRKGKKAYVEIEDDETARYTIYQLDGREFKGTTLRVSSVLIPSWVLKSYQSKVFKSWGEALNYSID